MLRSVGLLVGLCGLTVPALAFDGWHLESETVLPGAGVGFDHITFDADKNRLFLGHRKDGLQVFDIATKKIVKTIDKTPERSSNGALLFPEHDLGVSTNEDGTITPFSLSTLEAKEAIKLTTELDTSFYDPATKRIFAHQDHGGDIIALEVPSLKQVGVIKTATKQLEHGVGDGKGTYYVAARDLDLVYKIDAKALTLIAELPTGPGCLGTNSLAFNAADNRLLIGCRGRGQTAPAFAVLDPTTGKITFTTTIGAGNDDLVYDPELKRVFAPNGVAANLVVLEPVKPDEYRVVETLGTRPMMKTIALDPKSKKLYGFTAEFSADGAKKINTAISPFYPNTYFPNTFRVMTFSR